MYHEELLDVQMHNAGNDCRRDATRRHIAALEDSSGNVIIMRLLSDWRSQPETSLKRTRIGSSYIFGTTVTNQWLVFISILRSAIVN